MSGHAAPLSEGPVSPLRQIRVLVTGFSLRWFGFSFYSFFVLLFLHNEFGLSYADAGLDVAVIALATLPFSQIGGGFSDLIGRRRVIVLSLAGEAAGIATLAWGFTLPSLPVVLGALVLSGAFAAMGFPATIAYVPDSFDGPVQAKGLSWLRVGGNLGAVGGVAIAGLLLTFIAAGQLAALAALLVGSGAVVTAVWLSPSRRDRSIPRNTFRSSPSTGDRAPGVIGSLGRSLASSFRPIWKDQTLSLIVLTSTLIYLMNLQILYAIPTFGLAVLGIPYGILGIEVGLNGLIPVAGQISLTTALSGRSLTRVGIWGVALYAISFLALGIDGQVRAVVVGLFAAAVIVSSVGECLCFLPVFSLPLRIAPERSRGVYSGTTLTSYGVGGIFAPLLAGVALTFSGHPLVTWGILAAPAIPAGLILWHLESRIPRDKNRV